MKYLFLFLLLASFTYPLELYKRSNFKHWHDYDNDCQDTRIEVLIDENLYQLEDITYSKDSCKIIKGVWYDPYSSQFFNNPKKLDVDHLVPLKNAWISGAHTWTKEKRELYANYLEDKNHLIATSYKENRSKGDKSPDKWMPSNKNFHVDYCYMWAKIKIKWELSVTKEEFDFLKNILKDSDTSLFMSLTIRY